LQLEEILVVDVLLKDVLLMDVLVDDVLVVDVLLTDELLMDVLLVDPLSTYVLRVQVSCLLLIDLPTHLVLRYIFSGEHCVEAKVHPSNLI
jgi:hypothetical protein